MAEQTIIYDAVSRALATQPWWVRRKDSLVAVAGTILQAANLLVGFADHIPAWLSVIIACVIGVAQIVIHAGTKGAITPSIAPRLEAAVAKDDELLLPVYEMDVSK